MKKNKIKFKQELILMGIFIFLFLPISQVLALEQQKKIWLGVNTQQHFSVDKNWFYTFYTQWRFVEDSHPWQTVLFEGGIGYDIFSDKSLWLGYRWSGHNFNNNFYQMNRLIQQLNWHLLRTGEMRITSRTRLEEAKRSNKNPIQFQIRERLALELKYLFYNRINPYFYDEVFFQLNKTEFTANKFVTQNRLLVGFNYYLSQTQWLEIGYLNQYQWRRPSSNQNQMNHVLSLIYNF